MREEGIAKRKENEKKVKILFRRKNGSQGAIKAFFNKRLPLGEEYSPRQFHLGYLPFSENIREYDKRKLTIALRQKYMEMGLDSQVEVDWGDAERKWKDLEKPKKQINREEALRKIWEWIEKEAVEKNPKDVSFGESYQKLSDQFGRRLGGDDDAISWWLYEESPRLYLCFERWVRENKNKGFGADISPKWYLRYLVYNIRQGLAVKNYLRHTRNQQREIPVPNEVIEKILLGYDMEDEFYT